MTDANHKVVYVQEWISAHGDEGEGHCVVAVHTDKDVAVNAVRNDPPPPEFSDDGGYFLHEVPLVTS